MNNKFDPKHLWWLVWILGAILAVKLIWVVIEWATPLPMSGTEQIQSTVRHRLHYRYRLASDEALKAPTKPKTTSVRKAPSSSLASYRLVGIYSRSGYAVVTLVKGAKSFVLSTGATGGEVAGYHLLDANVTDARFQKDNQITTLHLYEKKLPGTKSASAIRVSHPEPASQPAAKPQKTTEASSDSPIVETEDGTKRIDRALIREYSEDPQKIWKNIGLYEVKSDGKLDGFKVRFVRRDSPFAKLGLQRGDVIKAIDGEPIVDYATPMRMLRSAGSIEELSITIERNHEEQELKYEVK